jgi:hypothetical protein
VRVEWSCLVCESGRAAPLLEATAAAAAAVSGRSFARIPRTHGPG